MYVPPHFKMEQTEVLADFIRAHSFGVLVTVKTGFPFATHLPFLVRVKEGRLSSLVGHVARANPHWQDSSQEALAMFSGPHAYISPSWYGEPNTVPTWNYQAVHVRGLIRWFESTDEILPLLREMVAEYEAPQTKPWDMASEAAFVDKLAGAVVGFELDVKEVLGKWKLSQNHSQERRTRVVEALRMQKDPGAQEIAALMASGLASTA